MRRPDAALAPEAAGLSFADFVFVRTAALPFAMLRSWSRAASGASGDAAPGFETLDPTVRRCFVSAEGELALRLASPSLSREFLALRERRVTKKKRIVRLNKALTKYFIRWGCRATPFGLFAKVAIAAPREPVRAPPEGYFLQVDQAWVRRLWKAAADPRSGAFRNPTLHEIGERSYFFVHDAESGAYSLRSIDRFDDSVLGEVSPSPSTAAEKGEGAAAAGDHDALEAAYEDGVVVAPAAPRALGPRPLEQLQPSPEKLARAPALAARLESIRALEREYDTMTALRSAVDGLEAAARGLDSEYVQRSPANVTALGGPGLRPEWLPELKKVASRLPRLLDLLWQPSNAEADGIRRRVFERFGSEPVPLLELASQVLWPLQHEKAGGRRGPDAGGAAADARRESAAANDRDRGFESWAFQELSRWPPDNELRIGPDAVAELRDRPRGRHRNQSGYVLVSMVRADDRPRVQVRSIVGPTALSLLGRFAGASPAIASFASKIAETEQAQSDGVVCDVSFLPSFQGLNVIYRPGLRAAEIGLDRPLREATAPRQLDLGQLYLRAGERLELYSAELGCAVHPRISCAYNQRLVNDTLFRILAAVQNHEDSLSRIWNWGLQALRPQTPRVSFDDLILCPARWRIRLGKAERAALKRSDDAGRQQAVARLRRSRDLPRWVQAGTFDQQLSYDLDNPLARLLLAETLADSKETRLEEAFVPDGDHAVEIALPFFAHGGDGDEGAAPPKTASRRLILATTADQRDVSRRWGAFEVFAHYRDFDHLVGVCRRRFQELSDQGLAKRWFYVRYNDPAPHLRYRIEVDVDDASEAMPHVLASTLGCFEDLRSRGVVEEVRSVAYAPELQRYGGAPLMGYAHEVFWQDSELLAALLPLLPQDADQLASLLTSCFFIDRLLARLELSWPQRRELTERICAGLAPEFPDAKPKAWGREYRRHRAQLVPLLAGEPVEELAAEPRLLARLAALEIGLTLREYRDRVVREQGIARWSEVLWSILHMHVNRAFTEDWRWRELRIMQLLGRCYAELEHTRTP